MKGVVCVCVCAKLVFLFSVSPSVVAFRQVIVAIVSLFEGKRHKKVSEIFRIALNQTANKWLQPLWRGIRQVIEGCIAQFAWISKIRH